VVSSLDDHVSAINTALRDAGHPAHCSKVARASDLREQFQTHLPDLIIAFGSPEDNLLKPIIDLRDAQAPDTPVLLASETVSEDTILEAMSQGALDVVSLKNIPRLQAVTTRELDHGRLRRSLNSVESSAQQYLQELQSLKQGSVESIADIQEGIIVNANPAWLELFGYSTDDDLGGHPIMDLCSVTDRSALKGALAACLRGKWDDSKLCISGLSADDKDFSVEFSLDTAEFDGEPAVRLRVAPALDDAKAPVELVEQAVHCDPLTGLYNGQHFIVRASERAQQAPAGGVRAVAYLRPDRFSRAWDDVGLTGSEAALAHLGRILKEYVQPGDLYGRFGGTVFVVMLERGTMADTEAWAEQLVQNIGATVFEQDERSTALTCSVGLCEVNGEKQDVAKFLTEAEKACRLAREQGGNQMQLSDHSSAVKNEQQEDAAWVQRIRDALMDNRLRLEHQPVASLNNEIDGTFDTLVRMLDEEGNTILPGEFIPVAERTGLIKNIDRWVIGESMAFCAKSNAQLVFVRLSRESVVDESLFEWLQSQLQEHQINSSRICFEVDEEVAGRHLRQTQALAAQVREQGFRFAIEHFGNGNSSQQLLSNIPMEFVKIDGSLMQGLHKNTAVQNTVKELARLAREQHVLTIAERVQDANTMAVLWQLGISYIQGNYVQSSEIVIEDVSQTSVTTRALSLSGEAELEVEA